ncbi:hypothetical protein B0186_00445 [Canicola haemoglobinophilus]|uniref:Mu-like phage gp25 n=1 Tax=Canicola haemoglobinophilus TaxID=733 RepID=A0A1V4B3Z8_9PAST|nr:DUF2730 family protein [Canicola haemoglobinophilus]OOS02183.1 hypothetical protein B0186_00445 [Canicola haemoglobinophilus]STO55350.1 Mu-like phage gp25 [Canicola haemoglobinophilus]STO59652.1 Mu-like phage gp25 [Canicola haemoglobinophilus]STO69081.1 Mu-like phage gp25 [Canicola haemoglobinophilus]
MMDILTILKAHWGIILTLAGLLASVFWLKMDSRYVKKSDFSALREEVNKTNHRVDEIDNELLHLPSAKDVTDLRIAVVEMKGETQALRTEVKGLAHQVQLLIEKEVSKK